MILYTKSLLPVVPVRLRARTRSELETYLILWGGGGPKTALVSSTKRPGDISIVPIMGNKHLSIPQGYGGFCISEIRTKNIAIEIERLDFNPRVNDFSRDPILGILHTSR